MKITEQKLRKLIQENIKTLTEKLKRSSSEYDKFEQWLITLDQMTVGHILDTFGTKLPDGADFDTPGYFQDEELDYDDAYDFFRSNMGASWVQDMEKFYSKNKSKCDKYTERYTKQLKIFNENHLNEKDVWSIKGLDSSDQQDVNLMKRAFELAKVKIIKIEKYNDRAYFITLIAKDGKAIIDTEIDTLSNVFYMNDNRGRNKIGTLHRTSEVVKGIKALAKLPGFGQTSLVKVKESLDETYKLRKIIRKELQTLNEAKMSKKEYQEAAKEFVNQWEDDFKQRIKDDGGFDYEEMTYDTAQANNLWNDGPKMDADWLYDYIEKELEKRQWYKKYTK